jgi:2-C-methyl-D-erythritol 4-phosphate cytidylyltransferase
MAEITAICSPFNAKVVIGGETRTESVYNALKQVDGDIVLIHDGARPFVTQKIIEDCIATVTDYNSAICALPSTDTTVIADNKEIASIPARDKTNQSRLRKGDRQRPELYGRQLHLREICDAPPLVFGGRVQ